MCDKKLYSEAEIKYGFTKWHESYINESNEFVTDVTHVKMDSIVYGEEAFSSLKEFING